MDAKFYKYINKFKKPELKKSLFSLAVITLILIHLLPIWLVKFPPLQDFPNHLLRAKIIKDYLNPLFDYNKSFLLSLRFMPNLVSDTIIPVLARLFPILVAGKIFLSLYIILFPLSIFYFLNVIKKEKIILGFLGFLFIYNWFFNVGFINFCFSIPIFFFALGYWWKNKENLNFKNAVVLTAMITLLYLSHFFSYCTLVISILFLAIAGLKNIRKVVLSMSPFFPTLLCAFIFFLRMIGIRTTGIILPTFENKLKSLGSMFISFLPNIEIIFALFSCLLLSFLFLKNFRKACNNIFFFLFLFLFFIFLLLPKSLGTSWAIDARMIPFLAVILFASVIPTKGRSFNICLTLVMLLSICQVAYTTNLYFNINKALKVYYEGIKNIPEKQTILPITTTGTLGRVNPYLHFWAYYHISKGGASPYLFTFDYQPIKYKKRLAAPSEFWVLDNNVGEVDLDRLVEFYDYILIWGKHDEIYSKINKVSTMIFCQGNIGIFKTKELARGDLVKWQNRQL